MQIIQNYLRLFMIIMCYEMECVTSKKSHSTNEIIHPTITNPIAICSKDKLAVKGYNVNISLVVNATCFGKVKFVEVFALNRLYIDTDLNSTGHQIQLSLIAPFWVIIGNRKIVLNGKDADEHEPPYAPDGIGSFRHGRPGRPGVSAGQLLGIAYDFINESNLEIYLNGGRGGPGQHGGKGFNGINGEDPPIADNSTIATSFYEALGFEFEVPLPQSVVDEEEGTRYDYIGIMVFGRSATTPGEGGHGGVGGIGGYAGNHFIVGLRDHPTFSIFANQGANGIGGQGGRCGEESQNGITLKLLFQDIYNPVTDKVTSGKAAVTPNCTLKSLGVDGIDDYNDIGIENPSSVDFINPSHVINNYKSFVRRSAAIDKQNIAANFVEDINSNDHLQTLYDALGFVDEMLGIETHYFVLKDKNTLTSYLTSLLKRIEKLTQNFTDSIENKDVLTWLSTTIMMRLSNFASNTGPIVDFPEYLNEIEAHILKLRRNAIEVNVNDQQCSLNNEIRSVEAFIKNNILPELEAIIVEISSFVSRLVEELYERQYKFKIESDPCSVENDTQIENDTMHIELMMIPRDKMFPFKALNIIFSNEQSIMIGTDNEDTDKLISGTYDSTSKFIKPIFEVGIHSEKYYLLIEQLNDIERELNQFPNLKSGSNSMTNITRNVVELKTSLTEQLQNAVLEPNHVDRKRDELILLFEKKQSEFSSDSNLFDIILAILNLKAVSIDFYKQLSIKGITKLLNFYEKSSRMKEDNVTANREFENVYDTILDKFNMMESSFKGINHPLTNKSHFQLDEIKWRTVGTIRDIKAFFRKMSNDTSVSELLCRSIEELDDTTVFLFETYDYVDHLKKAKSTDGLLDSTLNKASKKLEKLIQTNIILEKYGLAVRTFEKQTFPFASKSLMSVLELPTDFQPNDNETLATAIIDRFYYLKEKVKSLDVLIGKYDHVVLSNIEFSSKESSLVGPFQTWIFQSNYNEYRLQLLKGEEIELKSNISMAKHFEAVKFNEIGIKLIIDKNKQKLLNSELEKCIVTMTMIERADYRCDTKIHSFALDYDLTFTYSFKQNSIGQPVIKNDVYEKIDGKRYFLSPYTTWKIRIQNMSTANLLSFQEDEIKIELFGRGQYILQSHVLSEVCSELN